MKLLDLLRSLNSGNTTDPDAPAAGPLHIDTTQRAQLLDELDAILHIFDTEPAQAAKTATAEPLRQSLLNLSEIFDEDANDDATPEAARPTPVRREYVQTLLEDLLSVLDEEALQRMERKTLPPPQ
jgi:hypothetical protein